MVVIWLNNIFNKLTDVFKTQMQHRQCNSVKKIVKKKNMMKKQNVCLINIIEKYYLLSIVKTLKTLK